MRLTRERRVRQLDSLSGTLELPSDRPAGAHSAQLAATSCETREIAAEKREQRATAPSPEHCCVRWVMAGDAYITACQQPTASL
jgi:hypothetical protein